MTTALFYVALFTIGGVALTWALHRDLCRADARRRLRASDPYVKIRKAFVEFQVTIVDNLTPALRQAADQMAAFARAWERKP